MGEGSSEKGGFGSLARKVISKVGRVLFVEPETPIEELTPQEIARLIKDSRGLPVSSPEEAEREENLIWLPDLMREEGYFPEITSEELTFVVRAKNRASLDELCRLGALEMVTGVQSKEGEQIAWREINSAKTDEIAAGQHQAPE